jgi:Response regulator containing CheY-like receiver domain and AraC-type DNA-binding domain
MTNRALELQLRSLSGLERSILDAGKGTGNAVPSIESIISFLVENPEDASRLGVGGTTLSMPQGSPLSATALLGLLMDLPGQEFTAIVQPRFCYSEAHRHDFIELVYVYSGRLTQIIDGKTVSMEKGDACLLDTRPCHAILPLSEEDIVVNLLFCRRYFDPNRTARLAAHSAVSGFLLNASLTGEGPGRSGYLLFRSGDDEALGEIVGRLLREYFDPGPYADQVLDPCLEILFAELSRIGPCSDPETVDRDAAHRYRGEHSRHGPVLLVPELLQFIRKNCAQANLPDTAARFHMKPAYLSRLLKLATGKNFTQIVNEARLNELARLLIETDVPITELIQSIGYENINFVYRKFKERFGVTPAAYRDVHRESSRQEVGSSED